MPPVTTIRMLHFADLHIGMENYGQVDPRTGVNGRVLDLLHRLDDVVDYALEHEADLVLFAGDAFKTRDPNPTYQRELALRIKQLSNAGVPILLLVGNHDLPAVTNRASSMDIFHTLSVPHVTVGRRDELHRIETRHGPLQVATLPYPVRNRLLSDDAYRGMTIAQLDQALRATVGQVIGGLREQLDPALPAVLAGHFSVSEARVGSERNVMLGRDVMVLKSALADPAWDYVALGHVHLHQDLNAGSYPSVVYSGSLERIDFGEEGQPKGFCWVELARGETTWQFVELPARTFVTIRADLRASEFPMATLAEQIERAGVHDSVVRVVMQMRAEQESLVRDREVRSLLSGAYFVGSIVREVERPVRARLGGVVPESLTPQELLDRYFQSRETAPDRATQLLQAARPLLTGNAD